MHGEALSHRPRAPRDVVLEQPGGRLDGVKPRSRPLVMVYLWALVYPTVEQWFCLRISETT